MTYLSKLCQSITPYIAGEQPQDKKYIKLNTNENPYPPSVSSLSFDMKKLARYPDPNSNNLRAAIAKAKGVACRNVFVGNGSDEVLAHCFKAFFDTDKSPIMFADVTYSFYPVYAKSFSIPYREFPLKPDFTIDVNDYISAKNCQGILIANPNAPTSIALCRVEIEKIITTNMDKIVIIDEAYIDFCNESVSDLVLKYENLVTIQTFSKSYSLAGIRCGFALASEALIDGLNRIKDSFNSYPIDSICQNICELAVQDTEYYESVTKKLINTREQTSKSLQELGFTVLQSSSNFLFCSHKSAKAEMLYKKLKEFGVLVRYFNKPRIDNFLRITIGTDEDMQSLITVLANIVKGDS